MVKPKYGGQHQALRRATLSAAYGQPCARCGRPMFEGQELHLDHDDRDPGLYLGYSHGRCNTRAGGKLGATRRVANRRQRLERHRMLTAGALGVQISTDRRHVSIAAAGRVDGEMVAIELAAYLDGVGDAVSEVLRLRAEMTAQAVVIDPHSPAATLIKPLTDAGVTVTEPSTSDVTVAHGSFLDLLGAGKLRVASHPMLDLAARHGIQRPLSGAATWDRRGAAVDIGPLDAATLAAWSVVHRPAPYFGGTWK